MYSIQDIKKKFRIVGNSVAINRAIQKAMQVASTDISVLVTGESGVGKEFIPQIIHSISSRKHNRYIAINCGAIPEGTIDSELFGHEKGAFTGAITTRKGYFEVADGGSVFLDEIADLPLSTQVKLLRILETGEFMKVGSSKIQKTSIRIIAATNINLLIAIEKNKFREDLFYRLNTVQIDIPSLRERKDDIELLFNKFSNDFMEKYNIPPVELTRESLECIQNYHWPGNVRQLRNFVENISVLEMNRVINVDTVQSYLNFNNKHSVPLIINDNVNYNQTNTNDREAFYQILFKIRKDINDLKSLMLEIIKHNSSLHGLLDKKNNYHNHNDQNFLPNYNKNDILSGKPNNDISRHDTLISYDNNMNHNSVASSHESLFLHNKELEFIQKALKKSKGKRKIAAKELGISERTLYRKIKQYGL
jgi:transcriptional regulator with PAS, ATPase and Fis domain